MGKVIKKEIINNFSDNVYDITIKDNHNYFTNGALIHNCVDKNTKIRTENGYYTIKYLVDNKIETRVLSYNESSRRLEYSPITAWHKNERNKRRMFKITYNASGHHKQIICTEDHKLYTKDKGWVRAKSLTEADYLFYFDALKGLKYTTPIKEVTVLENYKDEFVYDLTIKGNHNYIAERILVHNCIVIDEAQKTSDSVISERILPMLSGDNQKVIKIGVPLYRNHFYKSFCDDKYTKIIFDWTQCPILLKGGSLMLTGLDGITREYPKKPLDLMPLSLKMKYFPNNPEVHYDGDMSETDFKTQYMIEWVDSLSLLLNEEDKIKLIGTHNVLDASRMGEEYYFGIDFASGTLVKKDSVSGDFHALSIWRKNPDLSKEKVFGAVWSNKESPLEVLEECKAIINPVDGRFKCRFGLLDYSVLGVAALDDLKRNRYPVEGVMFGATEAISHKNYKNALVDLATFELKNGRVRYPNKDAINSVPVMKKGYTEWCNIEREEKLGPNARIEAIQGLHDDVFFCLSEDTKIPLLNGETKTIKEISELDLQNKNYFTYSANLNDNTVRAGKILNCYKTGTKKVIKIVLDNDKWFECTPEHLILMRDGTYKEAKYLKEQDSLMPLYRKITAGIPGGRLHVLGLNLTKVKNILIERLPNNKVITYKELINKNLLLNNNHKVKTIINENKTVDVYDIQLNSYHNFALECGIFVHNCDTLAIFAADKATTFKQSLISPKTVMVPTFGGSLRNAGNGQHNNFGKRMLGQ